MAETWATIVPSGDHGTRDWATSHIVTATDLDTEIRDRMDWLYGALTGGPVDVAERRAWHLAGVAAPAVNQSARATRVSGTVTEFTSGTHPLVSTFQVDQLSITAGTAATTTAANLHVQTEPTGATNNYAVYVAGGKTRLVGDLVVNAGIVINNIAAAVSGTDKGLEVVKTDLTAGNAYGIMSRPSASTLQATSLVGVYSRPDKSAGTTTLAIAFQAGSPVISAGSYGTYYGYYIDDIVATITTKWGFYAGGAINSRLTDVGGKVFIGDTVDTDITTGLCINQGAADDAIITGKSSDVAHGMTTIAETDTWLKILKASGADGGARFEGISDGTVGVTIAATVTSDLATPAPGSAPTTLAAPIQLAARKKDTTGVQAIDNDDLLLGIYNNTNGIFYFNTSGRFFSTDGTAAIIDFDTHDDFALLNTFQNEVSWRGEIPEAFADYVSYKKEDLQEAGILIGDEPGKRLINWTLLWMLLVGHARQDGLRLRQLEAELAELKRALPAGGMN